MKARTHEENKAGMLTLTTGALTLPVMRDGVCVGELVLRPDDTEFLARFYDLLPLLEERRAALETGLGEECTPAQSMAVLRETCAALRGDIDKVFGEGTSALVFGTACSMGLVQQFFEGVAVALRDSRAPKLAAYTQAGDGVLR